MAEPDLHNEQRARASLPPRALFVWSREDFPFYARLAIESLLVNAPDLLIELHLFGEPPETSPHFRAIRRRGRVVVEQHGRLPSGATHRSSALRLLHERGGLLLDFGMLVTAPIHHLREMTGAVSEEQLPDRLAGRPARSLTGRLAAAVAQFAAHIMWRLCPTTLQPELERFSSFRWLNRCWLHRTLGRTVVAAPAGADWVLQLDGPDAAEPPDGVTRLNPPCFLEAKPLARITDRLFDGDAWPAILRLFVSESSADERTLRLLGPKDVVARQKRNRSFRAAYGVMCANGLQRYALHSKNSSRFDEGQSESGVGEAISSPDLKSLS